MFFDWGNRPINSTSAVVNNATTSTLLAELDSTMLGTVNLAANQKLMVRVNWILAADTNCSWQLDLCNSTALSSANCVDSIFPRTPTFGGAQFVTEHELFTNYRLRARVQSTFTGNASAYISAQVQT